MSSGGKAAGSSRGVRGGRQEIVADRKTLSGGRLQVQILRDPLLPSHGGQPVLTS